MDLNTKTNLLNEYVKKVKLFYMPLLKFSSFNRFDIKDGQIVGISKFSLIYSIVIIVIVDIFAYLVILETAINNKYLTLPEYISLIEITILNNVVLLNINFMNRHSGAELVKNFIAIDVFLGIEQTKFMRRISYKDVIIWCSFIASFEVSLGFVLISTFKLPIYVYIIGLVYFTLQICMCYDHVFHVVSYKFLCMRIHFLNIALVKKSKLYYKEYLTDQLLVYPLFWKKEYDVFVNSGSDANSKYFTDAFKMIFDQLQRITKCYRFLIFCCTVSLVIGTFLAVQTIIIFLKNPDLPVTRTFALTGSNFVSWTIFIGITQQTDKFHVQIQRTKLICTYIQLKPNYTGQSDWEWVKFNSQDLTRTSYIANEIFELSMRVLDILSVSDNRYSIYDLFYFNRRLLISIATSVFIYITMQLQIAFPKRKDKNK